MNIDEIISLYNEGLKTRSPTFFPKEKIQNMVDYIINQPYYISIGKKYEHWLIFIMNQLGKEGNQIAVFQILQLITEVQRLQSVEFLEKN